MHFDVSGYRMHYEIAGDSTGEPLLWLSGWTGTGVDWKNIFQTAPDGFRIIGPDLRGNGASTGFEDSHSFAQSAHDVFKLLDHLSVRRFKAIGLSGGGIVLLHMAAQQPERISAMVAVSAPSSFPEQARKIQQQFSFNALPPAERSRLLARSKGGDQQITWLFEQVHQMARSEDLGLPSEVLSRITARTLIVFGDTDPLYPLDVAFQLQRSIRDAALWVVPGGGHGPIFGAHAPTFRDTALSFLRGETAIQ